MISSDSQYRIYVCTHIDSEIINDPVYKLIHTGQAFDKNYYPGIIGDDTGDNISIKKDKYDGLLTGLYWVWKNTQHEYKGICTYRGYLGWDDSPLTTEDLKTIFEIEGYDFVATRYDFDSTVEQHFKSYHNPFYYNHLHDPLVYTRKVIQNSFPNMVDAYDYCMHHYSMNYRHTFVGTGQVFDLYAKWVFDFIDEFEKYAEKVNYPIAPRFFGYLIERLERVWIITMNIHVLELPVVYVSDLDSGKIKKRKE